ncbi:MAG: hypothetical protein JWR26_3456 [Pedosphaera sp.]|nr:hypothetical protein [Pedosphaera sp.]
MKSLVKTFCHLLFPLAVAALLACPEVAHSQNTAITYQGRLTSGSGLANGNFDFTFALFNSSNAPVQIGPTLTNTLLQVTNGLFSAALDFGSNAPVYFNGTGLWLEIGVRTGGATNAFTILAPRQPLTPVPFAMTASNVSGTLSSSQLTGILPVSVFPATLPAISGANLTGLAGTNLVGALPPVNGFNLTNLNATNLTGVIPFANGGNGFKAVLNVRNYGAMGDGVTDDSIAIRNCIKSAATNSYAVVYIPSGTYLLNTTNGTTDVDAFTLNCIFDPGNNTTIYGDGIDKTILRVGNNVVAQSPVFHLATGVSNVTFQGMTIDCNIAGRGLAGENYGYDGAMWFNHASNVHVADIKAINTGAEAFDVGYSSFVTVERCIAVQSRGSGFTFSGPNGIIRDCQAYGCGFGEESFDTTRHWGAGLTIAYGAGNMVVENCQFITNCMNLQVFACGWAKIKDCYFQAASGSTNYDLYFKPVGGGIYEITVTGCNFNDAANMVSKAVYGVSQFQFIRNYCSNGQLLLDNCYLAQVLNNEFISGSSAFQQVVLTDSTLAEVALNYFSQNSAIPILVNSPNNTIHNNVFRSCLAMVDIESGNNTFAGNTGSDNRSSYDVYLAGPNNSILNNALVTTVRFGSSLATGNQIINNTGGSPLIWDVATSGNTIAFNNFPASSVQGGNTYLANLQGQLGSGAMNFDVLNVNTANIGTLSVGNPLPSSVLQYRAGTTNIASASTFQTVAFRNPFPASVGSSYRVALTYGSPLSSAVSASVTNKSTNGFAITLNSGVAGGVNVDWIAYPDN